jgi:ATP-dependent RNA helicase DeaD
MSRELLEGYPAEQIVSALLQYSFQEELDERSYTEIEDVVVDTKGTTRLFVAQGKKDGLTPIKLISFIQDKCGIRKEKIKQIQILDKFSFVTLPFNEAEILLSHFRKRKKGNGLFISEAKERKKKG